MLDTRTFIKYTVGYVQCITVYKCIVYCTSFVFSMAYAVNNCIKLL